MLAIEVVNQSIMGRPPLQDKLSTQSDHSRPTLRQSRKSEPLTYIKSRKVQELRS